MGGESRSAAVGFCTRCWVVRATPFISEGWATTEPDRREPRGMRSFRPNAKRDSRSWIDHLVSGVVAEARNARIRRFRGERTVCRYAVPDR